MKQVLLLWDEFGQQDGPMRAFLFNCNRQQYTKLLAVHGKFVNSTATSHDDPVNALSDKIYANKLDKYLVKWPIQLDESVTVVHAGFLP